MEEFTKFKTFEHEINEDGSVSQQKIIFNKPFGDSENSLPVEADRYRLFWMPACPHAHKVIIVRQLLGLDKVISLSATGPYRTERGWTFSNNKDGKDPVTGVKYLEELYLMADPNYQGRPTVPLIADLKTGKAVNNDYVTLTIQFETVWSKFHKKDAPDIYPEHARKEIDKWTYIINDEINLGVYKVGFAHTQSAYEKAYDNLFRRLDHLEEHLSKNRYLLGEKITDSDIRLYPTLARFDIVYYLLFKANKKRIMDYPNLWGYARDLYQEPAFKETTDFSFIKDSYYRSPHLKKLFGNTYGILPKGPDVSVWNTPHDRARLSSDPQNKFLIEK